MNKFVVIGLISLLLLLPALYISSEMGFVSFSSANLVNDNTVSKENSYMFISPLRAQANGSERIRLTIFLLNNKGGSISGVKTTVKGNSQLTVEPVQPVSDAQGKTIYDIQTTVAGTYYLEVTANGIVIPDVPSVQFDAL